MSIAQRVQLRQDDVPLGEQTVSQVSVNLSNETNRPSDSCRSVFLSGTDSFAEFRWIDTCKSIVVLDCRFHSSGAAERKHRIAFTYYSSLFFP